MSKYRVTTDLFTLPYKDGQFVLYAPLVGFMSAVNEELLDLLAGLETLDEAPLDEAQQHALDYLAAKGVVNGATSASITPDPTRFAPSKLTLFPTSECNLRCRYCYVADAAETRVMDWAVATSAIRYFIKVLKREGKTVFPLEFHGGGEPLFAWNLVKRIVAFAEEQCAQEGFDLNVFSATNGVLNERQRAWIVEHFTSLNVSFDVLPHVQDYHRATASRHGTFDVVDRTLKHFDAHDFPYGIRCTVSTYNEHLLEETIDFVTQHYNTHLLFIEPVSDSGCGAMQAGTLQPDMARFVENYKRLEPICAKRGVRLEYSGAQMEKLSPTFCYVGTDNFAVTPDGHLTNCWEVTSADHPLADPFLFGRILPGGDVAIDQARLDYLRTFTVDRFDYCKDCFARWHCAGDCPTKLGHQDYHGPRGGIRCETNRQLIAHRIIQMLEREHYYQHA
ncbi:MAG: radical SAM protein [Rhodothermales bacterium]